MSFRAPSKRLLTHTHTRAHTLAHTPYSVSFHATRDTEGIRRGLCNKERTKQFKYGCGTNAWTQNTLASEVYERPDGVGGTEPAPSLIGQFGLSLNSSGLHHTAGLCRHAAPPPPTPPPRRGPYQRPRSPAWFGECVCVHMPECV